MRSVCSASLCLHLEEIRYSALSAQLIAYRPRYNLNPGRPPKLFITFINIHAHTQTQIKACQSDLQPAGHKCLESRCDSRDMHTMRLTGRSFSSFLTHTPWSVSVETFDIWRSGVYGLTDITSKLKFCHHIVMHTCAVVVPEHPGCSFLNIKHPKVVFCRDTIKPFLVPQRSFQWTVNKRTILFS